jgi:hypothetical protein
LSEKAAKMTSSHDALIRDLGEIASLLHKYKNYGQAKVVEEILATLTTFSPDYERLRGVDLWGGAGAVWEVGPFTGGKPEETRADELAFRRAFIRLADTMNQMDIGTEHSRFIATTFQSWMDKGI